MRDKIILLADDDIDDTEMFCEALALIDANITCHCAINGNDAIKILESLDEKPQIIFLDLNMPIMTGWECLILLKGDKRFKDIPVIMMSTSSHQKDIDTSSKLGALCYFVKPNNFNDLQDILKEITDNLNANLPKVIHNLNSSKYNHIFTCSETR